MRIPVHDTLYIYNVPENMINTRKEDEIYIFIYLMWLCNIQLYVFRTC